MHNPKQSIKTTALDYDELKMRVIPLISPKERLAILKRVRGTWKNKKPDPIKELEKMRKEWDQRKLPSLHSIRKNKEI